MRVRTRGDVRATRERERSVERSEVETKVCERAVSGGGRAGRGGDGATVEGGVGEEEEAKVAELVELVELEFVREREWEREFEHVGVIVVVVGVIVVVVGVIVVGVVLLLLLVLLVLLARPKEETPRLVQATLRIE